MHYLHTSLITQVGPIIFKLISATIIHHSAISQSNCDIDPEIVGRRKVPQKLHGMRIGGRQHANMQDRTRRHSMERIGEVSIRSSSQDCSILPSSTPIHRNKIGPANSHAQHVPFPSNALLTAYINRIGWSQRFGLKATIIQHSAISQSKSDVDPAIVGRTTVPQTWRGIACTQVGCSMQKSQIEHGGMVWKEVSHNKTGKCNV